MEKNIHNDRLEDYVKKSFEDYEEMPPGDMWSRIEPELPLREPANRVPVFFHTYKWQMAAAAVILLLVSRLMFVQSYYEQQLLSIASHNQHPGQINSASEAIAPAVEEDAAPPENRAESRPFNGNNNNMHEFRAPAVARTSGSKNISSEGSVDVSDRFTSGTASTRNLLSEEEGKTVQQFFNQSAGVYADEISLLPGREPGIVSTANPVSITPAAIPVVKPIGSGRKWYVLAGVAPGRIIEPGVPPRPGMPRPVFASRSENPETATSFSLRIGRTIGRKLALEGGLAYLEFTRQTIHRPRFEFREGQTIPGGGGHHQQSRSFQYDLNTYGGSASVTLRADVVSSNIPGENEQVEAEIRSNENVKLLQIPLTAVARIGDGQLSGVVRAGIVGNYLASNSFEVTAYRLDNPELQPQSNNSFTIEFHKPGRFFPGYQLALGVEYRISEKISVSAFPSITSDFPRKDRFRGGYLPGQSMLAFTAAATCWF